MFIGTYTDQDGLRHVFASEVQSEIAESLENELPFQIAERPSLGVIVDEYSNPVLKIWETKEGVLRCYDVFHYDFRIWGWLRDQ